MKKYRELERIVKGFGNHRRLELMELLSRRPELSLGELADTLHIDYKNASEHVRKLTIADLVMKRNDGNLVRHTLTPRGKRILEFCRIIE